MAAHPIADYIRVQNRRASTITNNKVRCKVPSSVSRAQVIEDRSKQLEEPEARLMCFSHSKRKDVRGTELSAALRRVALGIRQHPTDVATLSRSWTASHADRLMGRAGGRRVDADEEKLIKKLARHKHDVKFTLSYINGGDVKEILSDLG